MLQKLKSFIADDAFYYSALVILVAGASFGLGRQSVIERNVEKSQESNKSIVVNPATPPSSNSLVPTPQSFIPAPPSAQPAAVAGAVTGEVVASKSGTKYHLPTCSGAKSIKPDNLISFPSVAAAEAAGYSPAANCPGLK